MNKQIISETYSHAADQTRQDLCCAVDYRREFAPEELAHIPAEVLDRNYGCGIPTELRSLERGKRVLDLGPGLGRDCFIAARRVGPDGRVYGVDMNPDMLQAARRHKEEVVGRLGYDNLEFLEGQFDQEIPLPDGSVDVIFSNCVNNLAVDKPTAYAEMYRVLSPGSKLSFSDIVSYEPIPSILSSNEQAWADCVGGVLCFSQLQRQLAETGFEGVTLTTDYLWMVGPQIIENYFQDRQLTEEETGTLEAVRLYSVLVEAFKPVVDPKGECFFKGQFALYHGPGVSFQLDADPDHVFPAGEVKEVCEKTATILKSPPFNAMFTVFEPQGDVQPRLCIPGGKCC